MKWKQRLLIFFCCSMLYAATTLVNGARKFQSNVEVVGNLTVDGSCSGCATGGSVNAGTAGQVGYYASSSNTISGATVSGAVKAGNPPTQAACADLSNAVATCSSLNAANLTGSLGNGQYYGTLCTSWVTTDENTANTGYVDLSTVDSCTFTLAATTSVAIIFQANVYIVGGSAGSFSQVFVDGTAHTETETDSDLAATTGAAVNAQFVSSLASGSHTITIKHKVNGNTGHWRKRLLVVEATP